jgi:hypothetical protein
MIPLRPKRRIPVTAAQKQTTFAMLLDRTSIGDTFQWEGEYHLVLMADDGRRFTVVVAYGYPRKQAA